MTHHTELDTTLVLPGLHHTQSHADWLASDSVPCRQSCLLQALWLCAPDADGPPLWRAGYMLHDRVLRPAEVGVVRQADGASAP